MSNRAGLDRRLRNIQVKSKSVIRAGALEKKMHAVTALLAEVIEFLIEARAQREVGSSQAYGSTSS